MELKTVINESSLTFQNEEDEIVASLDYIVSKDAFLIMHTNVHEVLRGQGIASKLMNEFCDYARKENKKIQPVCSYGATWFEKHLDQEDLLAHL